MNNKLKQLAKAGVFMAALSAGQASAGLIDRGNGLIYDDVLDVTWLQNANLAGTAMAWDNSKAWAANLSYQGFDNWRLPTLLDTGVSGCNYSTNGTDCGYNVQTADIDPATGKATTVYSELAYMFYTNLGNVAYFDTSGNGPQTGWDSLNTSFSDANTGANVNFTNLTRSVYWSGTEYAPSTNFAWFFGTGSGGQGYGIKGNYFYAWAVRDGDVAAPNASVPEPASLALFGCGLLGLMARRRQRR